MRDGEGIMPATADPHTRLVEVRDGRRIGVASYGQPDSPVCLFYFHATTSSRLEARLFDPAGRSLGVRVIGLDRPGAGRSDPQPGRRLLDWPDDVADVADHLGIDRFAVVGQSVGAAHALVCGHALPGRVSLAVPINSLIPVVWQPELAADALPSERFPLLFGRATAVLRLALRVWGLLLRPRTLTPRRFSRLLGLPPEDRCWPRPPGGRWCPTRFGRVPARTGRSPCGRCRRCTPRPGGDSTRTR